MNYPPGPLSLRDCASSAVANYSLPERTYDEVPVGRPASTLVKMVETVCPIPVIAPRHTMMIKASITAYSVAVGPSSDTTKDLTR